MSLLKALATYYFFNELNYDNKLKNQDLVAKLNDGTTFDVVEIDWDSKEVVLKIQPNETT